MRALLNDLLRVGRLGEVVLGIDPNQAEVLCGSPDLARTSEGVLIRRYGDVDLMFSDGQLGVIELAGFSVPRGGGRLEVDAGIVRGGMLMPEFRKELLEQGIPFEPSEREQVGQGTANTASLVTGPGVTVTFFAGGSMPGGLFSISYCAADWYERIGLLGPAD
jgi:hypothetical protein